MNDLQRAILKKVLAKGYTLNPMDYCPEGHYTDFDEWDAVNLGNGLEFQFLNHLNVLANHFFDCYK